MISGILKNNNTNAVIGAKKEMPIEINPLSMSRLNIIL
jgi:hypothetical protein